MTHRWSWNCPVRSRAQCSQNHLIIGVRAFDLPRRTFVFHREGLWRLRWCGFGIALGSEPRVGRFSTRFSLLRRGRAGCWESLRRVGRGSRPCSSGAVMRSSLVGSDICAQKLNINFVRMSSLCEWVRRTRISKRCRARARLLCFGRCLETPSRVRETSRPGLCGFSKPRRLPMLGF